MVKIILEFRILKLSYVIPKEHNNPTGNLPKMLTGRGTTDHLEVIVAVCSINRSLAKQEALCTPLGKYFSKAIFENARLFLKSVNFRLCHPSHWATAT